MKKLINHRLPTLVLFTMATLIAPLVAKADVYFTDNFSNGSTTNLTSTRTGSTNASATSYDIASTKNTIGFTTINPGDFKLMLSTATGAGGLEAAALFATNGQAASLVSVGDYVDLTVTFINSSNTVLGGGVTSFLWLGLFNSGGSTPVAGGALANSGLTTTASSSFATGNCANWQGYVSQIASNGVSRLYTRPLQNGASTTSANQDLLGDNAGSGYFLNPRAVTFETAPVVPITLTALATYTVELKISLVDVGVYAISNQLYSGASTGGTVIFSQVATNVSGTTNITAAFDGLAIGLFNKPTSLNPEMDITSIQVTAQSSPAVPPTIPVQPVPAVVATNGGCEFVVGASGIGLTYQWYRNNAPLADGGHISGSTTPTLIIAPSQTADSFATANGYYVKVTGAGNLSTYSTTNSLTLINPTNLVWSGAGNVWNLNTSANWQDTNGNTGLTFNYGDPVTFDDTGMGNPNVTLTGSYLSAASVTINSSANYAFAGSGSIAGPGNLIYAASPFLSMNLANTYSGGTLISNATSELYLYLQNYNGLGTGPVTLNNNPNPGDGGGHMEIVPSGNATLGINGDIIVADDFTIKMDGLGTFGAVFLGNLSGTAGKTLTINPNSGNSVTNQRVRIYGTSTTNNANLVLNSSLITLAPYLPSGFQVYNGTISGDGNIIQRGNGTTILNGDNTYTGGTTPTSGSIGFGLDSTPTTGTVTSGPIGTGPLYIQTETNTANSSGTVFASGGARTIANSLQYPTATNNQILIIGGSNALTFTGPLTLNGNDLGTPATNRIFQVSNTNNWATLTGLISDNSQGFGFTKTGPGTLALNNAETYTGLTTVSGGVLAGSGSVTNSVLVATNGAIGGGTAASMGTFTVGGSLTLTNIGGGFFRVNRAGSASDHVSVGGALTNSGTGTITVTNLGATLQLGDMFTLFNKAMSNGAAMNVIGGGVAWGNNLAVNGSIIVVTPPDTGVQLSAPASVLLGANITNTITVTNVGPGTAFNLVVTDAVPANATFVKADSGGATNGHLVVVWNLFSLAPNTFTNFTVVFNATTAGNVTNIATVVSSSIDTNPANNSATNITAVTSVIIPGVPPRIGSFSLVGGNVVIGGTNGVTGGTYYLLGTTNLVKPLVQWTPMATNVVITNGASNNGFSFTGTNVVVPGLPQQYYILSSTNNR